MHALGQPTGYGQGGLGFMGFIVFVGFIVFIGSIGFVGFIGFIGFRVYPEPCTVAGIFRFWYGLRRSLGLGFGPGFRAYAFPGAIC